MAQPSACKRNSTPGVTNWTSQAYLSMKKISKITLGYILVGILGFAIYGFGTVTVLKAQTPTNEPQRLGSSDDDLLRISSVVGGMKYDLYYSGYQSAAPFVVNRTKETLEVEALRQQIIINRLDIQLKTKQLSATAPKSLR